jgi:hypothetical protein
MSLSVAALLFNWTLLLTHFLRRETGIFADPQPSVPAWPAWLASVPFGNSPGPQSGACVSRKRVASLFCLRACHNTVQSVIVTVSSSIIILSERFAIESLQGISPSKACLMQESFGRLQHMRQVRICTAKSSSSVLRPRRYYAEATSLSTLFNRFTECPCGRQTSM